MPSAIEKAAKDAGLPVKEVRPETSGKQLSHRSRNDGRLESFCHRRGGKAEDRSISRTGTLRSAATRSFGRLPPSAQTALAEQATEQAQRIIESRLDAVGVAEPLVQRHGSQTSHQILVQMPGIQDPERVKQLLKAESKLELVHVISPPSPAPVQTYITEEEAKASLGATVPTNRRVLAILRARRADSAGRPAGY